MKGRFRFRKPQAFTGQARVITGSRASSAGHQLENDLDKANQVYAAMGIALVRQLPVPTVPCRGDIARDIGASLSRNPRHAGAGGTSAIIGRLRMRSARQGYDYFGFFGPNSGPQAWPCSWPGSWHGLAIAMEAKTSGAESTSLPIVAAESKSGKKRTGSGIQEHQLKALAEAYRDFGVVSTIVWRLGDGSGDDHRFVLMPDKLLEAWSAYQQDGGRKSIPVSKFTPYDLYAYANTAKIDDWLFPLRVWLEHHGRPSPAISQIKAYSMIEYQLNPVTRQITARRSDGTQAVLENARIIDRSTLDGLAHHAPNADEFINQVSRLSPANEVA